MFNKKVILFVLIITLTAGNIFFSIKYFIIQKEFQKNHTALEAKNINKKILNFTKLFIVEVLKADGEVDFETRLKLENAVRDLADKEVLIQWQKFTESETEFKAQEAVKNLLGMLINKIKIQP